jgi:rare lipoprotein A
MTVVRCKFRFLAVALFLVAALLFSGCAKKRVPLRRQVRPPSIDRVYVGLASFYGPGFAGRKTASGQIFDPQAMTAAHRTLPFGSRVRVTNLKNNRAVVVKITDRGPNKKSRIIDLSVRAAKALDMLVDGVVRVRLEVLSQ